MFSLELIFAGWIVEFLVCFFFFWFVVALKETFAVVVLVGNWTILIKIVYKIFFSNLRKYLMKNKSIKLNNWIYSKLNLVKSLSSTFSIRSEKWIGIGFRLAHLSHLKWINLHVSHWVVFIFTHLYICINKSLRFRLRSFFPNHLISIWSCFL